ncbi:hypothetical protein BDZ97DRAFT_300430 [Flammula alnicola]|nr:hypothetical protein BDZ97DRAFT_300430 [Flammula alnicola]
MFFNTFFTTILLATASVAAPINSPQELIVFNPPITSPKASVSWPMGSQQVVKWDTTDIPVQRVNTTGLILLGYMENGSENLDIDRPLATGFPINAGSAKVIMPKDIPARNDYFVVLFGDSGNRSPEFKISTKYA